MSGVPKESIQVIAQTVGLSNVAPDVFEALAPDVEYRVREIMQEAIICMRHSRRTMLRAVDVDTALKLRNVEPIYGFASDDSLRFKKAAGHQDLFYLGDNDVEFREILEAPLAKAPLDVAVTVHWLALEGVQPAIPQNAPVEALGSPTENKKSESKEDGLTADIKTSTKHILSKELQLYFDKIVDLTLHKSNTTLFRNALWSLSTDSGLHHLIPYFTYFVKDEVSRNLQKPPLLLALMRIVQSLLQNPHIHIELYLHQLMPAVITCLVGKRLGNKLSDNQWVPRDFSAKLIASICKRFGHVYHNLQPRVTRTLLHAFLDPTKALPQHYGAIQGLAALGPSVVRLLILPNLEPYLQLLEPEMQLEKQKNETKRNEAWQVYGALLRAAGLCIFETLKKSPILLSSPNPGLWKSNGKTMIANPNKRKASTDNLMQQPPLKKAATDGPMGVMPLNSLPINMQGLPGYPNTIVTSTLGLPSSASQQFPNANVPGSIGGREVGRRVKASGVLGQAWKDDTESGDLLLAMFNHFGESIIPFTPRPEMFLFI
uniref:TATA box binding protein associated factor (TAF) histone-like fold domain-containing protein n=1 Tax=Kalanchoe fedtschenkoi TaxID=63787 RepID=A0A7N0U1Z9_KALFE